MSPSISKRHHYIPQFLIRNWAGESEQVWVYNQNEQRIHLSPPSKVFVEKYLYTYQHDLESAKSDEFEKHFSIEEGIAAKILRKIIVDVRAKQTPILDPKEAFQCKLFLITLIRRTPESQHQIRNNHGDAFLEAVRRLPETKSMGLDDPAVLYQYEEVRKMKKMVESNVNTVFASGILPRDSKQAYECARDMGMLAMHVLDPRHGFVLGSHGHSYRTERDKDGKPSSAAWFPITPDIAIAFTNQHDGVEAWCFDDFKSEDRFIREVNESAWKLSKYVVATDEQRLKDLRRQHGVESHKGT